jgi:hypothetical protein
MTTAEKCEEIFRNIVERCNKANEENPTAPAIAFGPDWGGNALTIYFGAKMEDHTHVGWGEGTFEKLIDGVHALLLEGKGLSLNIPLSDVEIKA